MPGHFTLAGRNLRIHVDAREARYPITIDPFIQTAKVTASDGTLSDWFGFTVAVRGDTVVVGALEDDNDTGSVYVFTKPDSGWSDMTQTAKLTASDGVEGDIFGGSLAISDDTIVVGARLAYSEIGSAYVFTKPDSGWSDMTQTAKLAASDGEEGDWLGMSVGISGDTIVVGATNHNSLTGAAYVYVKPASGWTDMSQSAKLTASDGAFDPLYGGDQFGFSVAISGDTIVVGALLDDTDVGQDVGSAYVFTKPASGWTDMTETAKLTASDSGFFDIFGSSVAISGDTIVVGAYYHNVSRGAAYVFVQPTSGWTDMVQQTAKLTASDEADDYRLGYSLSISGDIIMVGGLVGDDISYAYVFRKPGGGWTDMTQTIKLTSSDNASGDYFGSSVAINGDTIVVGAYGKNFKTGAAYIFDSYENGSFSWPIFFPAINNKSVH